jgi:hypothetical protein
VRIFIITIQNLKHECCSVRLNIIIIDIIQIDAEQRKEEEETSNSSASVHLSFRVFGYILDEFLQEPDARENGI